MPLQPPECNKEHNNSIENKASNLKIEDFVNHSFDVLKPYFQYDIYQPPIQIIETPEPTLYERLSILGAQMGDPIFIRIFKIPAILEIWIQADTHYELLKTYRICKQSGRLGPKLKEGDLQGPEGFYSVTKSQLNPNSKFHLSFNLGYPNIYDRAHERTGSALMVHGNCVSVGCFAMTDSKIEEIYELVEKALEGNQTEVKVQIFPFPLTKKNLTHFKQSQWYTFWLNLKTGYDYFEAKKTPPIVEVKKKQYIFK